MHKMGKERYKNSKEDRQEYDPKGVEDNVAQGELYSPSAAMKHKQQQQQQEQGELYSPSAKQSREEERKMRVWKLMKQKVLEKLGAAAVPKDTLDKVMELLEMAAKDASGITRDALNQIKTRILDVIPSSVLSPSLASKVVDDAEKEASAAESGSRVRVDDGDDKNASAMSSSTSKSHRTSPPSRL